MPRIDPYVNRQQLDVTSNVTANAGAFGAQTAQALSETGNVINEVEDAKSRMRSAAFMTQSDLDWRQKMIGMQNDPEFAQKYGVDGSGFADAFKSEFQDYARQSIGAADPRDAKYVEQGMYNLGESLMGSAMEFQAKAGAEFAVDTLTKTVDNATTSARLSPSQYTSILANANLAVQNATNLDPTQRRRFMEKTQENVTTGAALGLLERDGVAAAKAIMKGGLSFTTFDEAGKPVRKPIKELVSADTFNMLSNQAETTIRKAQSEENQVYADMKSDITTRIEMAETPDDFLEAQALIDKNKGFFKHTDTNDLTVKLYKKSKELRDDYDSVDRGNAFASGDAYLNPADDKSVKDFNNYYAKRVEPVIADMPPAQRNAYLSDMVNQTKILPDRLKGDIQSAARSNDPKLVAATGDFITRLRFQNPHVLADVDQKDLARIDMVNQRLASGLTVAEATTQVDAMLDVNNKATFDKRAEDIKTAEIDYQSKAMSNFDASWLFKLLPGDSGSVRDKTSNFATRQISQLTSEYKQAYETQYKLTGDVTASEKYANQLVAGQYGVTNINGTNQLMKYPPEKYFGMDNVDNNWMRDQMVEEANKALAGTMDADATADDILLTPVPYVTPDSVDRGQPLYKLMKKGKDGTLIDVLGTGKYFTFDRGRKVQEIKQEVENPTPEPMNVLKTRSGVMG